MILFDIEPDTRSIAEQLTQEARAPYQQSNEDFKPAHLWPSLSPAELEEMRTVVYDRISKIQSIQMDPNLYNTMLSSLVHARDYLDFLIQQKIS